MKMFLGISIRLLFFTLVKDTIDNSDHLKQVLSTSNMYPEVQVHAF